MACQREALCESNGAEGRQALWAPIHDTPIVLVGDVVGDPREEAPFDQSQFEDEKPIQVHVNDSLGASLQVFVCMGASLSDVIAAINSNAHDAGPSRKVGIPTHTLGILVPSVKHGHRMSQ